MAMFLKWKVLGWNHQRTKHIILLTPLHFWKVNQSSFVRNICALNGIESPPLKSSFVFIYRQDSLPCSTTAMQTPTSPSAISNVFSVSLFCYLLVISLSSDLEPRNEVNFLSISLMLRN